MTPGTNRDTRAANENRRLSLIVRGLALLVVLGAALSAIMGFVTWRNTESGNTADPIGSGGIAAAEEQDDDQEEETDNGRIYKNITVNGIDLGGLTISEAETLLVRELQEPLSDRVITFTGAMGAAEKGFDDFDAAYDITAAVNEAYGYTRQGSADNLQQRRDELDKKKYDIECGYSYSTEAMSSILAQVGEEYYIAAQEPTFERIDGEFVVGRESSGQRLDTEQAAAEAVALLDAREGGSVSVSLVEIQPVGTAAEYSKATNLIGSFTTSYASSSANRISNVKLAAANINDKVVMPGGSFSTNENFKSRTAANGYQMAGQFLDGQTVDGIGGGICQVSSTLYMALLHAELEIVERSNHSMKVGYMGYACDATLSEGSIDLVFRNNTGYPVTVETYTDNNNRLTVNIYGYEGRAANRTIAFESVHVSSTEPGAETIIEDPALPLAERVVATVAKTGHKYQLYKMVYVGGALSDRVLINTSSYRAVRGVVRVGTGPAAEVTVNPEETGAPTEGAEYGGEVSELPTETEPPVSIPVQPTPEASADEGAYLPLIDE